MNRFGQPHQSFDEVQRQRIEQGLPPLPVVEGGWNLRPRPRPPLWGAGARLALLLAMAFGFIALLARLL